ncbi:Mss4-like protein, partial [Collybia nuda]
MSSTALSVKYAGGCFCGAVTYRVIGPPLLSAYCHCTLCQRLNASPFIHTIHFPDTAFIWTHTEPHENALDCFVVPEKPWKTRWRCKQCGCCISSHNSKANKWSVWAAQLERDKEGKIKGWDDLKPTAHMFYGTRLVNVDDGLGKWEGYENKSTKL